MHTFIWVLKQILILSHLLSMQYYITGVLTFTSLSYNLWTRNRLIHMNMSWDRKVSFKEYDVVMLICIVYEGSINTVHYLCVAAKPIGISTDVPDSLLIASSDCMSGDWSLCILFCCSPLFLLAVVSSVLLNFLHNTWTLSSAMLELILLDMVKMVMVITVSFKVAMLVIMVSALSFDMRAIIVVPCFMPMMFMDMNMSVIYINSSPCILGTQTMLPEMIIPPVI